MAPVRPIRFAALQVPTFRGYWVTSWISSTGDGMENVIRGLLIVQLVGLSAAPFWLGMMVFAHWIPFTLFSLYGGALADRYDNRKVQIVAQVLLMTAAFGVAAATLTGSVTQWWIFGLLLVHGFAGAIGGPAQQTLIHSIVGRDRLLSAVSLNSTARQLSQVVGPAIAGFVYLQFGPGWGFFVNGLTFVPLLLFLAFFHPLLDPAEARDRTENLVEFPSRIEQVSDVRGDRAEGAEDRQDLGFEPFHQLGQGVDQPDQCGDLGRAGGTGQLVDHRGERGQRRLEPLEQLAGLLQRPIGLTEQAVSVVE